MQWKSVLLGAALAAAALITADRVFSGDEPEKPGAPDAAALAMPGPEHEGFKAYEGSWEGKGVWGESAWTSRMTAKRVMGGRFLELDDEIAIAGAPRPIRML